MNRLLIHKLIEPRGSLVQAIMGYGQIGVSLVISFWGGDWKGGFNMTVSLRWNHINDCKVQTHTWGMID